MKKALERRKHCTLAVVRRRQIFAPPQTPFPGARDGQNLISWRWSLPLHVPTNQFGEDRCTQFRVIVVTDPQTHPPTNRQDQLQYTAPQLARGVMTWLGHAVTERRLLSTLDCECEYLQSVLCDCFNRLQRIDCAELCRK